VNRRGVARQAAAFASQGNFGADFASWAARLEKASSPEETTAAEFLGDAPVAGPLKAPGSAPQGLGRFTLSSQALKQAVRWMLEHAGEANPEREYQAWAEGGRQGRPRFSFGLYEHLRHGRIILEIQDLGDVAGDLGPLAEELEAFGGVTGFHTGKGGEVRFAYGLTVELQPGNRSLRSIRPGGRTRAEHLWTVPAGHGSPSREEASGARPAAPPSLASAMAPAPAAAVATESREPACPGAPVQPAPVQAPAADRPQPPKPPFKLNPRAEVFVMPGE
jgi:hypothetical protein